MGNEINKPQQVVVTSTKSVGISILLTLIFGPIGMFYSTVKGAIIWLILAIILSIGALASNPALLLIILPMMWFVSLIWGAMAVKAYNKKLLAGI